MCTSFELTTETPEQPWSYVEIKIEQDMRTGAIASDTVDSPHPKGATFVIITHERGELPFSAYDRNIYTPVPPSSFVSLYYSKLVTKRANTFRNPCHVGADSEWLAKSVQRSPDGMHAFDYLDRRRLGIKKKLAWPTGNLPYLPIQDEKTHDMQKSAKNSKTVNLFNTDLLYSREACAWAFCCLKVAQKCNCTCSMDWSLSTGTKSCPNNKCERVECSDSPIPYEQCPVPCSIAKFIKQNLLISEAPESQLLPNVSMLKFIRSENVQVAAEEEIYSLAKLFSEIGGLCSLFIGFSCIFIFELLEAIFLLKSGQKHSSKTPDSTPVRIYRCSEEKDLSNKPRESNQSLNSVEHLSKKHTSNIAKMDFNNTKKIGLREEKEILTIPVFLRTGAVLPEDQIKSSLKELTPSAYLLADSNGMLYIDLNYQITVNYFIT